MKKVIALFLALSTSVIATTKVGDKAPALDLEEVLQIPKGEEATLEALKGRVIVLEFWATWCGPCIRQIPHMNELSDAFQNSGVAFISVTSDKPDRVKRFAEKTEMKSWIGLDTDASLKKAYGIRGIPQTIVIGKEGKVLAITRPQFLKKAHLHAAVEGSPFTIDETETIYFKAGEEGVDPLKEKEGSAPLLRKHKPSNRRGIRINASRTNISASGNTLREIIYFAYQQKIKAFEYHKIINNADFDETTTYDLFITADSADHALEQLNSVLEKQLGLRLDHGVYEIPAIELHRGERFNENQANRRDQKKVKQLVDMLTQRLQKPVINKTNAKTFSVDGLPTYGTKEGLEEEVISKGYLRFVNGYVKHDIVRVTSTN